MKWRWIFFSLLAVLFFPLQTLAVDYQISDVEINAQLKANGNVQVTEQHTYEFDSKFNGITREIIPKKGASIDGFKALENGKALEVEMKNNEYRIHRKGRKETITIDLHYTILHAIKKYEDGAQFYWPFFDHRNESDYGNMTIRVLPPKSATNVLFLGYDRAEKTGKVDEDGTVTFSLGYVEARNNADIRVVYEPELFPSLEVIDRTIRPHIAREQERLDEERALYEENRQRAFKNGGTVLAGIWILLLGIGLVSWRRRREYVSTAHKQLEKRGFAVPSFQLTMPATMLFMNDALKIETLSVALLDLVRKGDVRQITKNTFELLNKNVEHAHEKLLIQLLFHHVGNGTEFSLEKLRTFTKNSKNASKFNSQFYKWIREVKNELSAKDLWVPRGFPLLIATLTGITAIVLAIIFGTYHFILLAILAILHVITTMSFLFAYRPKNFNGILLREEWRRVEEQLNDIKTDDWGALSHDDQFKMLIYAVGTNHPKLNECYKALKQTAEQVKLFNSDHFVYNPINMSSSFVYVSSNITTSSGSSSGGGTGGGGGGSGAF